MSGERANIVWIEEPGAYTVDELVRVSGLPAHVVDELIECGVLPRSAGGEGVVFARESVTLVRAARRLRDDFDLDHEGLAVVVSLLRRVRELEGRVVALRATADVVDR